MKKTKTKSAPKVQYKTYTRNTFEFLNRSDVYKYLLKEVKKNKHLTIVIPEGNCDEVPYNENISDRSYNVNRTRYLTLDGNCLWTPDNTLPSDKTYNKSYSLSCFVEDFIESKGKKPTIIQTIKEMEEFDERYDLDINYISLDKGKTWINIEVI